MDDISVIDLSNVSHNCAQSSVSRPPSPWGCHDAAGPSAEPNSGESEQGGTDLSTIRIGDLAVNRLGLGAMRVIDNDDIWGEPKDRANSLKVLRRAVELGIDFFDTAESYGSQTSETLIAEALYPREGLLAQAVLRGKTIGYVHHPQLLRFGSRLPPSASLPSTCGAFTQKQRPRLPFCG
jgi:hypothetical protein